MPNGPELRPSRAEKVSKTLFVTCFMALITSFGSTIRANIIGELGVHFNLSETQKEEIWRRPPPFALSIILFSLVIDRIGYGRALAFGFLCHVTATLVTIFATGYPMLYWGTFILALGNGTVEAVINPVVATAYSKDKTSWLNILHAGWPGGMVLGGLLILILMPLAVEVGSCSPPLRSTAPAQAKFPSRSGSGGRVLQDMLQRRASSYDRRCDHDRRDRSHLPVVLGSNRRRLALIVGYGLYVRKLGQPSVLPHPDHVPWLRLSWDDSWITDLVTPVMGKMASPGWV
jgi:hypothetical protein